MPVQRPRFDGPSRVRVRARFDVLHRFDAPTRVDLPARSGVVPRRPDLRAVLALCLALAVASCAGGTAPAEPGPGPLIIIGGGLQSDNEAVYRNILERRVAPAGDGAVASAGATGTAPSTGGQAEEPAGAGAEVAAGAGADGGAGLGADGAAGTGADGVAGAGADGAAGAGDVAGAGAHGASAAEPDGASGSAGTANTGIAAPRIDGPGPICVIPTASGAPESSSASAVRTFVRYGGPGSVVALNITTDNPEAASDPEMVAALRGCGGFYFTGGQQGRIVDVFRPAGVQSPAAEAVLERFRAGAPISGSSAGAAIMSDPMIGGGSSAGALLHGIRRAGEEASEEARGGVVLQQGMGYFPHALVDQHFLARGRIGRLIVAVLDAEEFDLGFGIDENTALVVENGVARVVGASGVVVVDAREARRAPEGIGGTDLRLTLLGPGDTFDLRSFEARPSASVATDAEPYVRRSAATGDGAGGATAAADPFARWTFLHLVAELATGPAMEAEWAADAHRIVLRKDTGFVARLRVAADAEGGAEGGAEEDGDPVTLFAGPFILDLVEGR
jgi:cyanophycinase